MIFKQLARIILISIALLSSSAHAATVNWMLDNVLFDDGSTATGTFDYDAFSNTYSNVNIETDYYDTGGFVFGGIYRDTATHFTFSGTSGHLNLEGDSKNVDISFLFLVFGAPLTDAGGMVFLSGDETQTHGFGNYRSISTGSVVGAVPIPAAVWLFGSGLIGLVGFAKRKKELSTIITGSGFTFVAMKRN